MTTTTARATQLRDEIDEAQRQMGIHAGDPFYGQYATKAHDLRTELRQMEES